MAFYFIKSYKWNITCINGDRYQKKLTDEGNSLTHPLWVGNIVGSVCWTLGPLKPTKCSLHNRLCSVHLKVLMTVLHLLIQIRFATLFCGNRWRETVLPFITFPRWIPLQMQQYFGFFNGGLSIFLFDQR